LFHFVDEQLGGLDVLVASVGLPADPLMEIDDAGWRRVIDANLVSYLACTKKAIDRIRTSGREDGQVILVGSISVHIKAVGESVYNASKGGVALFAETLRKEMIPEKIRVTLIEPGAIATHLQPYDDDKLAEFEKGLEMLPAGEVAEAILFAATRPPGVNVVTLRIEPLVQEIWCPAIVARRMPPTSCTRGLHDARMARRHRVPDPIPCAAAAIAPSDQGRPAEKRRIGRHPRVRHRV